MSEQVVSAASGGLADRTLSMAIGTYHELRSFDDQLERLAYLVTGIRSAVQSAEGVRIKNNQSLRRLLCMLQEAAREGEVVLLSLRRRAAEEASDRSRGSLWDALRLLLRFLKGLVGGDRDADKLRRTLGKLEWVSADVGKFLQMIEIEIGKGPSGASTACSSTGAGAGAVTAVSPSPSGTICHISSCSTDHVGSTVDSAVLGRNHQARHEDEVTAVTKAPRRDAQS